MNQADARWHAEELAADTFRDRTRGEHFGGEHRAVFRDGWAAGRDWQRDKESRLRDVVALLNSMILSGESHSETSLARLREAVNA